MKNRLMAGSAAALLLVGGLVLTAAAQGTPSSTSTTSTPPAGLGGQRPSLDLPCMSRAVETRENAIQAALDKFSTAIKSALETRKADLLAAWAKQDRLERRAAIRAAWSKYLLAKKAARKTFDQERNAAWKQFVQDRKQCGSGPTGENPAVDASL